MEGAGAVGYPPRRDGPADPDNDLTKPAYPASPYASPSPGTPYPPATWHAAPPPPPTPQRPRRRHPWRRLAAILAILAACLIVLAVIAPKHRTTTAQTIATTAHHPTVTATTRPTATATPTPSFAAPLLDDTVAITDDNAPSLGNMDIFGDSYSAEALRAVQLVPGMPITFNGITFTWPAAAPGSATAMHVHGQHLPVQATGTFATLAFLGASYFGNAQAALTLQYADGSVQHATLGFTDWTLSLGFGTTQYSNAIAANTPYHNNGTGQVQQKVYVFEAEITLPPGKTLARIDFPPNTTSGQMLIFAIAAK
jgi:hypothetical protein